MMLPGWGTLAVPAGKEGAEYTTQRLRSTTTRSCHECLGEEHLPNPRCCRDCGAGLPPCQRDSPASG